MQPLWLIPLLVLLVLLVVYLWPTSHPAIEKTYAKAPAEKVTDLKAFRANNPTSTLNVAGVEYQVSQKNDTGKQRQAELPPLISCNQVAKTVIIIAILRNDGKRTTRMQSGRSCLLMKSNQILISMKIGVSPIHAPMLQ